MDLENPPLFWQKTLRKSHFNSLFNKFKDFDNMYVKVIKTMHIGLRSKSGFNLKQGFLGFELSDKLKKNYV